MADAKIMVMTWNQELARTEERDIEPLFPFIKHQKPDIIVIGLQEAAPTKGKVAIGSGNYVGALIAKKILGVEYEFVGQRSFAGITKGKQLVTGRAHQVIEVLKRRRSNLRVDDVHFHDHSISLVSEKGFLTAMMKLNGNPFVFLSTHLDAKSADKREKLAKEAMRYVQKWLKGSPANVSMVVMGDMNYRAVREKSGALGADESSLLLQNLATPSGRRNLMRLDSFVVEGDPTAEVSGSMDRAPAALRHFNVNWPRFNSHAFPTYKRSVKTKDPGYQVWRKIASSMEFITEGLIIPGKNVSEDELKSALSVYTKHGAIKEKRAGYYDFGWLDRIGYRLKPPLRIQRGAPVSLNTLVAVTGGDHVPVYLMLNLSGF